MKTLFIFLISLTYSCCFGQNFISYFNQANKAEYYLSENNTNKALSALKAIETNFNKLLPKDYFYVSILYYLKKDSVNGFLYLRKCAENYGWPTNYVQEYRKNFPELKISDYSIGKISELENLAAKHRMKSVEDTLMYFMIQDQSNRDGSNVLSIPLDAINQNMLLNYLKTNGIPNIFLYGDMFSSVLLHITDEKVFSEFESLLIQEIKKGNIYPYYYTSMIDRKLADDKSKTKYNSYLYETLHEGGTKKKINKNRMEIGLSTYFRGTNIVPIAEFKSNEFKIINQ